MKKVLYVYGGPEFHPTERCGKLLKDYLKADGRFELTLTNDLDVLISLPDGKYDAVVLYTTGFEHELTADREHGLLSFVKNGGGFVGIHSAADSFRGSRPYIEMLNAEFDWHTDYHEFKVSFNDPNHYLNIRMPEFSAPDEMYHLKSHDPAKCTVLAHTTWQGKQVPFAFTRKYGNGRVVYLASGHDMGAWQNPDFKKLALRSIAWSTGAELPSKTIRCGLLGYGPAFNMGKGHAEWINKTPGLQTVAMCDVDPGRIAAAKEEHPEFEGYFSSLDDMLKMKDLDLIVNILPHNLHASTTLQSLDAGKHVVLEKPFCIDVAEANAMVQKYREKGLLLSLFNNRRWDGDYLTIHDLLNRGLIGDIYRVECGQGGFNHPGFWWRSDKSISGGVMHDWGAHFLDWILNLVPAKITQVMGDFQKRVWHAVTNEDFGQVTIKFENGVTADYWISSMAAISRPKWLILGTRGAIQVGRNDEMLLVSYASGVRLESKINLTLPAYGSVQYYRNVADHLLMGEELVVKPEQARRVIGIIEAGKISSELGKSVPPIKNCE
ncbi:ThuA domain-containing protein [candidate division KSB1 bacterium]|nr:ThuA domain-containing protein [candidate division KSB1 bacterium]